MYYSIDSWQKVDNHIYDSGNAIVLVKQQFLTSLGAIWLGGITSLLAVASSLPEIREPSLELLWPGIFILLGLFLLIKGLQGHNERKAAGGVHPTDSVYTLDRTHNSLRRRTGDMEEQLATFEETKLELHIDRSGKNTSYKVQIVWPTGKEVMASKGTKKQAEALLANLRQRLGFPPEETPTQS